MEEMQNINPLKAKIAFIYKPVNWFPLQINWLVSIWLWDLPVMSQVFSSEAVIQICMIQI